MKKLKERGKDKYVQNRLRYKLTCTACLGLCSSRELAPAAAFIWKYLRVSYHIDTPVHQALGVAWGASYRRDREGGYSG